MSESQDSRRGFLKAATLAIGGLMGAVMAFPLVRYLLFPVGRKVVDDTSGAVDVLDEGALAPGAAPVRVQIRVHKARNAWGMAEDVTLGAAWVRKAEDGSVHALSSVCPHLGCAVDFDHESNTYKCPCHRSAFAVSGDKITGPSKRGLDPLPVQVEDGRVKLTLIRYRPDIPEREPT